MVIIGTFSCYQCPIVSLPPRLTSGHLESLVLKWVRPLCFVMFWVSHIAPPPLPLLSSSSSSSSFSWAKASPLPHECNGGHVSHSSEGPSNTSAASALVCASPCHMTECTVMWYAHDKHVVVMWHVHGTLYIVHVCIVPNTQKFSWVKYFVG